MIALALTGNVVLGRGVNEALRTLDPEQVWGNVLPLIRSADLRIVDLECQCLSVAGDTTNARTASLLGMPRSAAPSIRSLRFCE